MDFEHYKNTCTNVWNNVLHEFPFLQTKLLQKLVGGLLFGDIFVLTLRISLVITLWFERKFGRKCQGRYGLLFSAHEINRAVYTKENKPQLSIAAAYIRREHPV